MKRVAISALLSLVSVLSLAGCIAGEVDMIDPDIVEMGELAPPIPMCVLPPKSDTTVVQSNGGDIGSEVIVSSPDNSYYLAKGNYIVEVTNVKNDFANEHNAVAYSTHAADSKTICEQTKTTATLYGFHDLMDCWIQIGATKTKQGVYSPGTLYEPASCADGVSWDIPSTVSKVRIKGNSVRQMGFGLEVGQMISEGTYWFH